MAHKDDDLESWEYFVYETLYPWCWACGRGERPPQWHAPWVCPQRAHIGSGGGSIKRRKDRKQACLLCPLCHGKHRPRSIPGCLSNANMMWLKRAYDPEYYDYDYLRRYWVGNPPDPEPLDHWFDEEYWSRHGSRPVAGEEGGSSPSG